MTVQMYFCLKGNYDQYVKTREELEENQMKRFNWEQDQIAHMKVNEMPLDAHVSSAQNGLFRNENRNVSYHELPEFSPSKFISGCFWTSCMSVQRRTHWTKNYVWYQNKLGENVYKRKPPALENPYLWRCWLATCLKFSPVREVFLCTASFINISTTSDKARSVDGFNLSAGFWVCQAEFNAKFEFQLMFTGGCSDLCTVVSTLTQRCSKFPPNRKQQFVPHILLLILPVPDGVTLLPCTSKI